MVARRSTTSSRCRSALVPAAVPLVTALAALLLVGCGESEASRRERALKEAQAAEQLAEFERMSRPDTTMMIRGMIDPKVVSAAAATLADDAPVIGIVIDGQARAYSVASMSRPVEHVLNDRIGGIPVSVTYCDRTDCVRAFRGEGSEPIDLWLAGFRQGRLELKYGETTWFQEDEASPLPALPYERMTWKEWRTKYPETDLHP
ncbi:MAG TPA: DUF3179 domain-containing (seleno)protein [Pirellulaceae bacterium]|nr:DUF3179 domain-containing (seleno)protein [Pirellulaceae bacterium]